MGGGTGTGKKRKIGIIIGSDSDLAQCEMGLKYLIKVQNDGRIKLGFVDIGSQHRHTLAVQGYLSAYSLQPPHEKVDVLIVGAGMANHLTGCCDAFLRNVLKDEDIVIYGVAFEDEKSAENTRAAILSIAKVPGTQVIFNDYVGEAGFTQACLDAVKDSLTELYLKPIKPPQRLTFEEALALSIKKRENV